MKVVPEAPEADVVVEVDVLVAVVGPLVEVFDPVVDEVPCVPPWLVPELDVDVVSLDPPEQAAKATSAPVARIVPSGRRGRTRIEGAIRKI